MNSSDLLPFTCNESYDSLTESLKYVITLAYLIPGVFIHFLILKSVLVTEKSVFKESSFFQIYAIDSIASMILILMDISFIRPLLFIPPLCPMIGPFFWGPSILLKILYYVTNHARFAKSVAQTFMVINRMSCVLMPITYSQIWKKLTPVSIVLIVVLPFLGTWNIILSRVYMLSSFGGFAATYIRAVQWASLSMFQFMYVFIALLFTIICTSITFFKLFFLQERIKSVERSLCISSIFISLAFLLVAVTQVIFAVYQKARSDPWLFLAQFVAFDTLTVGSGVIMVLTNEQLRKAIFKRKLPENRVFQLTIHSNGSQT